VYIAEKFGEDTLPEWALFWDVDSKNEVYIHVTNVVSNVHFYMTKPKTGFMASASEVKYLREHRDSGKNL